MGLAGPPVAACCAALKILRVIPCTLALALDGELGALGDGPFFGKLKLKPDVSGAVDAG